MYQTTGLRTWNLHANDLDEMVRFYQEVLGAQDLIWQTNEGIRVARMRIGETGVGLFDAAAREHPRVPHHTIQFTGGPATPEELVELLQSKGVKVDQSRRHGDGSGYSVHIWDPSGNRIELSTDPPAA